MTASVFERLTEFEKFVLCLEQRMCDKGIFPGMFTLLFGFFDKLPAILLFDLIIGIFLKPGLTIPLKWRSDSALPQYGNTKGSLFYEKVLKECHLRNEPDTIYIHKNIRVLKTPAGRE